MLSLGTDLADTNHLLGLALIQTLPSVVESPSLFRKPSENDSLSTEKKIGDKNIILPQESFVKGWEEEWTITQVGASNDTKDLRTSGFQIFCPTEVKKPDTLSAC